MPSSTLSTKGQAVIPVKIREYLNVNPGDRLDFLVMDNGDVVIRPATVDVRSLEGILHQKGRTPVSIEEMNRVIREQGGRLP